METVSAANGDASPLRFANVDAEIRGADTAFGTRIAGPRSVALLMRLGAGWLAVKIKDGAVAAITAATVHNAFVQMKHEKNTERDRSSELKRAVSEK